LVMYPELSQRRLLLCSCGVLVSALAEPHGHPGGSARSGAPVTKARAIEVAFVAPRCRPQASRLLAGVAEGRRLALAATRGAVANARDRAAITEAQGVPGPALEPLGYVRAMLAWALPLASEPTETKSRLWEIDRDCKGFDALTRSWGREALETLDADRRALFETYIEHHRPRRGTSAPLAIEKAVLGFAARMRLLARLSGLVSAEAWVAQGLLEARVRALCPELLGWYCAICELILSDGGGAGMATSAATAGSMTKK